MGWSGLVESVGLAEEKSVKTAHPSQIRDQGLFWAFLLVIGIDWWLRENPKGRKQISAW